MSDKKTPIRVGFYDIEKTIGKGNFAVVKLARHRLTKTEVAIKIIDKTQLAAADLRRAYREVRVLKKLHHPHIVRLYQVMETKNMLYIVTEYAPQGEIFEHIAKHGRLPEPAARRLYWQVVSAVDYCHKRGIVHRDLKAENLLLDAEGCVKLADFGFSTWWTKDAMLSTWCGSPPYAAPEVFEGRQYPGPEVDIWSLGVVLYVLVCGALPFDAATLPALRDRVLSARYRVPYFMSGECESLIRKMLVRDPNRRYVIDQVKRHRWMQMDGPPRLLPAPGHTSASSGHNPKQYLDPSLIPDPPAEPNEQILRLMASLGIDSSRTRESLKQQSYDHHAAIYYLLLERLRQHRPGRYASSGGGPPAAVRMMSTDSSTCRKSPRRPSQIAEHAMRKMVPGQSEAQANMAQIPQKVSGVATDRSMWKSASRNSQGGPSQTSSVDEGVADMDSCWDPDSNGSGAIGGHGSSAGSGMVAPSSSSMSRSKADWKWPARGSSTGSSVLMSSDYSQASGSPRESMSGSGTTLSSWDSAWEPGGLAASLPSCTAAAAAGGDERRSSINNADPESPLSPGPCLTSDRLWVPPPNPPGSPSEFRLGRRASDGLVGGRKTAPFGVKRLDGARAGGMAALAGQEEGAGEMRENEFSIDEPLMGEHPVPDPQLNLLCSPAKRPSLPDAWRLLPDPTWYNRGEHSSSWNPDGSVPSTSTSAQLHRQLMGLRLNRRSVIDPTDVIALNEASANVSSKKSVMRQQSYKLAQQQPVLPPMEPLISQSNRQGISVGMDPFHPITEENSRLHAHLEEDEEEEEVCMATQSTSLSSDPRGRHQYRESSRQGSPWSQMSHLHPSDSASWKNLPVTMADCKLADSNTSLSRLSPLLNMARLSSSPIPYGTGTMVSSSWGDQALVSPCPTPTPKPQVFQHPSSSGSSAHPSGHHERMDTSGA